VSRLDPFDASAARLIAAHGGDDGYTLRIDDPQATDDLATGDQTVAPRELEVPCTLPVAYGPSMIDGTRVLAGDAVVFLDPDDPGYTFAPVPGMIATVTGPKIPSPGLQYEVKGVQFGPGSVELHLRGQTAGEAAA